MTDAPPSDENEAAERDADCRQFPAKVKFVLYGEEMIEKKVKLSVNSGRVYLPPHWVGCRVMVVRTD